MMIPTQSYKPKYGNKKVQVDGITFDSKREANRYLELKLLERAGEISELELQKEYVLLDSFKVSNKTYRKTVYKADFTYIDSKGNWHIEDVKSPATRTQVYLLKKKLMAWKYGIDVEEV